MRRGLKNQPALSQLFAACGLLILAIIIPLVFKSEGSDAKTENLIRTLQLGAFALSYIMSGLLVLKRFVFSVMKKTLSLEIFISLGSLGAIFFREYAAACSVMIIYSAALLVLKKISGITAGQLCGPDFEEENDSLPKLRLYELEGDDDILAGKSAVFIRKYMLISLILFFALVLIPSTAMGGGKNLLMEWLRHGVEYLIAAEPGVFYISLPLLLLWGREKSLKTKLKVYRLIIIFSLIVKIAALLLCILKISNIWALVAAEAITIFAGFAAGLFLKRK